MGNILGSENFGIIGPKFLASSVELYYVQRMPSDRGRSARVGGSKQVLEKDTLGFANRLVAHRAIAKRVSEQRVRFHSRVSEQVSFAL